VVRCYVLNRDRRKFHVCVPYLNGYVEVQVQGESFQACCNPTSLGLNPKVYSSVERLLKRYTHYLEKFIVRLFNVFEL
jgi:hypothetical protein